MKKRDQKLLSDHERVYGRSELLRRQVSQFGWSKQIAKQEEVRQYLFVGMSKLLRRETERKANAILQKLKRHDN